MQQLLRMTAFSATLNQLNPHYELELTPLVGVEAVVAASAAVMPLLYRAFAAPFVRSSFPTFLTSLRRSHPVARATLTCNPPSRSPQSPTVLSGRLLAPCHHYPTLVSLPSQVVQRCDNGNSDDATKPKTQKMNGPCTSYKTTRRATERVPTLILRCKTRI